MMELSGPASVAEQIPSRSRARAPGATAAGIVAFAAATALAAQPEARLPFTPIPLTLQVLSVLLAGYWLGPRAALASQSLYLAAGAAGLPVFAGGAAGPAHLLGPTAGYLWAFPLAAWVVGRLAAGRGARSLRRAGAGLAGVAVIHLGGAGGLGTYLAASGQPLAHLASLGLLPFVVPDLLKAALAAGLDAAVARSPRQLEKFRE